MGELSYSGLAWWLMYLLDENYNPNIAEALRAFSWNIQTVVEIFRRQGVDDDEIIDWLGKTSSVWITQDTSAKRQYEFQLKTKGVSVVWIKPPKLGLSAWEQLKLLVRAIDHIHEKIRTSRGAVHFRLSKRGGPIAAWEEKYH